MQKSFSDLDYAGKKKVTQRDTFLAEIDSVTPWGKLLRLDEPLYPKDEGAFRPSDRPGGHAAYVCAQQCSEGIEDAMYDSQAIRAFVGID